MVYATLVAQIEAQVMAAQQAAWLAQTLGGKVEVLSIDDAVAHFDASLTAPPQVIDSADRALRLALGLRSGRG